MDYDEIAKKILGKMVGYCCETYLDAMDSIGKDTDQEGVVEENLEAISIANDAHVAENMLIEQSENFQEVITGILAEHFGVDDDTEEVDPENEDDTG